MNTLPTIWLSDVRETSQTLGQESWYPAESITSIYRQVFGPGPKFLKSCLVEDFAKFGP